jgi:type II secretory pathway pseudopilin PulG
MARNITTIPALNKREEGFSFIEAILAIALLGIAVLGLAEMFMFSIRNNLRSGEISQAVFLAQQQVDYLRTLTAGELLGFPSSARGELNDEVIDVSQSGAAEYRRLTQISLLGGAYSVKVLVFPPAQLGANAAALLANPEGHGVRACMNTVITR